ncbi:hypothetical protein CUS_6418 [Ruminococcus albus 8]|uniref:Uncharacterized protein n=1 Tax=Ruminococcus albus 8 TaxID=246199 RepID=E9S9W7_RUMAL|nr:hypothetical protein CUS_6418 [Ruminococcus albus 8]
MFSFPRLRLGKEKRQLYSITDNYDYPFSTPTKNAVNKRIIERCIEVKFTVCTA